MPIPIVNLSRRHQAAQQEIESRVLKVLRTGSYIGGEIVAEAEREVAKRFDRATGIGVNSGTDALIIALQAVGVRAGDEVIMPTLSFFATAGSVCALGATPVCVDVKEDATMCPIAAANAVTEKTTALVPVHLYGNMAKCPDLGVPVVDDSAQAIGGTPARSLGLLSTVSTYPTKTWGGAGDGGFIVGDNQDLVQKCRALANHGLTGVPNHHSAIDGAIGRNSRLDAIQAAVLMGQAHLLDQWIARRRNIADRYDNALPAGVTSLPRSPGSPVHQYVIKTNHRDQVLARMRDQGIGCAIYYPTPMHKQPALNIPAHTPVADELVQQIMVLPVNAHLTDDEVGQVIQALHSAVR